MAVVNALWNAMIVQGMVQKNNDELIVFCKAGYYGYNCEYLCGKCKTETICNNITGICPEGCQNRWTGLNCDVCRDGYYGRYCEHVCGKCSPVASCNSVTGICPDGCQNRWNGSQCNVCSDGFYGLICGSKCGQCLIGTICDQSTGVFPKGCKGNWTGPKCEDITSDHESTNACSDIEKLSSLKA
ncbi:scavenger receptor class F member 2-like [Saccostrea echinata]|uniref:scavenger receptor class F member 2-like n=1 Tax=Saccostrea echinata TaxID=191078 RepID=UPI002A805698|nr:scavenger receptor class F member 2-like [Saccostrea echinata]